MTEWNGIKAGGLYIVVTDGEPDELWFVTELEGLIGCSPDGHEMMTIRYIGRRGRLQRIAVCNVSAWMRPA